MTRAPKGPIRTAVVVAATLLVMVGSGITGAVYAAHQFPDVPNSSPFHDDVDWLVDQGIANGYSDGTFRPTAPISRQGFAAMLHRYSGRTQVVVGTLDFTNKSNPSTSVACPAGKRAVGGGGLFSGGDMFLTSSYPYGVNFDAGWSVWFESEGNALRSGKLWVFAICQPAT